MFQVARFVVRVAVLEEGVRPGDLVRLVHAAFLVFRRVQRLVHGGVFQELEQPGEGKLSVLCVGWEARVNWGQRASYAVRRVWVWGDGFTWDDGVDAMASRDTGGRMRRESARTAP